MAITLKHDTVTITKDRPTAYLVVENDQGVTLGTLSLDYTDKDNLKEKIRAKLAKFEAADAALKAREAEAKAALEELNIELAAAKKEVL